mgnify:CR=1 FL=1
MKKVNNDFRNALRGVRITRAIVSFISAKGAYVLTTENGDGIITELNNLLLTENGNYELLDKNIKKINLLYNTELFQSVCKYFELESIEEIPLDTEIDVKIGVKVNDSYEYIDYGYYYVKNVEYKAETNTYMITAYDKMYESMLEYNDQEYRIEFPITVKNLLIKICEKFNWKYNFNDIANGDVFISKNVFQGLDITYRDILDNISQVIASNLLFDLDGKLVVRDFQNIIDTLLMGGNSLYLKEALESNALEYSIDGKCEQETSVQSNIFDKTTITRNKYITTNGTLEDSSRSSVSSYIEVGPNKTHKIIVGDASNYTNRCVLFDSSKTANKSYEISGNEYNITTINDTKYIRFQFPTDNLDSVSVLTPNMPSPDYPSEIKTIKGDENSKLKVRVTGKNIFNIQKWLNTTFAVINGNLNSKTSNSISLTSTADDCYTQTFSMSTITNKTNIDNFGFEIKANTDYTFYTKKSDAMGGTNFVFYFDKDYKYISLKSNNSITNENFLNFTTPPNAKYICFRLGINKSGKTVEFSNIMLLKGTITTTPDYEPYKEKEVLIDLAKENLFNINDFVSKNSDYYSIQENKLICNAIDLRTGTSFEYYQFAKGTYTIKTTNNCSIRIFADNSGSAIVSANDTNKLTFTISANRGLFFKFFNSTVPSEIGNVYIYKGFYDSYELNSIGDIKDKLEIVNGVADIQKKIGKIILDGVNYKFASKTGTSSQNIYLLDVSNFKNITDQSQLPNVMSTHFKVVAYSSMNSNKICITASKYKEDSLYFKFGTDSSLTTVALANQFLQEKYSSDSPIVVYYELATPETITLPNTDIPLYEEINHVTLVEYLETTTSIKYKKAEEITTSINEDDIKNTNACIKEKYGPVNSLIITTNENVILNTLSDEKSINLNGKTELQIDDNYILSNDSDSFIQTIFKKINGIEYYTYDIDTIGLLIFDPLDRFNIKIGNNIYPTIMLNDDIQMASGLLENSYNDIPQITKTEYKTTDKNKKKLNNAIIELNKAKAEIVMKVTSDGKLAQVRLDGNAEDGTEFEVKADNIKLEGYTTVNGGFNIDLQGNMTANNGIFNGKINSSEGNIGGWVVDNNGLNNGKVSINKNGLANIYTAADLAIIQSHIMGNIVLSGKTLNHYDLNNDGVVDSLDYSILYNMIENSFN